MKSLVPFLLALPFLGSCAAVPIAAAVAVGVWSYDEHSDSSSGSLPVEAPRAQVWAAMKQVAFERATGELDVNEGSERIVGEMDGCKVYLSVLPFETTREIVEIKVRATQGVRPRGDIAKAIAEDIASRL